MINCQTNGLRAELIIFGLLLFIIRNFFADFRYKEEEKLVLLL